jgi:hypothetical protein
MTDSRCESPIALGFLTVVAEPQHGLIGGYLLVNAHARPLEFHCTVPIRANRAQEILYGSTLPPYLYGEQIGSTLVKTSKLRPLAVFTDCEPALAAAAHIDVPLWLVLPPAEEITNRDASTADGSVGSPNPGVMVPVGAPTSGANGSAGAPLHRVDGAHAALAGLTVSACGRNRLAKRAGDSVVVQASRLHALATDGQPTAAGEVDEQLAEIAAALDLSEPFDRIRAAIQEAQRGGR